MWALLFLEETDRFQYFLGNSKGGTRQNILFFSPTNTTKGEVKSTGGNELVSKARAGIIGK
jgi:hypothetical protein